MYRLCLCYIIYIHTLPGIRRLQYEAGEGTQATAQSKILRISATHYKYRRSDLELFSATSHHYAFPPSLSLQILPNPLNPPQITSGAAYFVNLPPPILPCLRTRIRYFSCSTPMHQSRSVCYVCDACRD